MIHKFLVIDEDKEPLKKFYSKREALWFIDSRPECSIVKLNVEEKSAYQIALETVGECII